MRERDGILYQVTSPSGGRYVGITTSTLERRWSAHCSQARRGTRSRLYSAIRKYGPDAMSLRVLIRASWSDLNEIEQRAIAAWGLQGPGGYNLRAGGSQSIPHKSSREKMRQAKLGTKHSLRTRIKMSAAHKGTDMTAVRRAAIKANTGAKRTPEQCERMRQAALRRAPASSEARANMSASAKKRRGR